MMFLMSGSSVTVVAPLVWSGRWLKARSDTSVRPRRKNRPPSVTMNDGRPERTTMKPCSQPKNSVKHMVIMIAPIGDTLSM